jgi:NMD protein affecting ribosome stability and mRNA decay
MKIPRHESYSTHHEQVFDLGAEDSYHPYGKLPEPTVCRKCGATYQGGRWTWRPARGDAHKDICPACLRIEDDFPGGYLALKGDFVSDHRDEVLAVVHAREAHEKAEHPLQRIMSVTDHEGGVMVTTTDPHLARAIAHALSSAFKGALKLNYSKGENLLRATWRC